MSPSLVGCKPEV